MCPFYVCHIPYLYQMCYLITYSVYFSLVDFTIYLLFATLLLFYNQPITYLSISLVFAYLNNFLCIILKISVYSKSCTGSQFFFSFDYLKMGIFLLVFSVHSLIQFFLSHSDVLLWLQSVIIIKKTSRKTSNFAFKSDSPYAFYHVIWFIRQRNSHTLSSLKSLFSFCVVYY